MFVTIHQRQTGLKDSWTYSVIFNCTIVVLNLTNRKHLFVLMVFKIQVQTVTPLITYFDKSSLESYMWVAVS